MHLLLRRRLLRIHPNRRQLLHQRFSPSRPPRSRNLPQNSSFDPSPSEPFIGTRLRSSARRSHGSFIERRRTEGVGLGGSRSGEDVASVVVRSYRSGVQELVIHSTESLDGRGRRRIGVDEWESWTSWIVAGHQCRSRRRTFDVARCEHEHDRRRSVEEGFQQFSASRCAVGSTPFTFVVDAGSQQVASNSATESFGQLVPQSSFECDGHGLGRRGSKVEERKGFPRC